MDFNQEDFKKRIEYWIDRSTGHGIKGSSDRQVYEAVSRALLDLVWGNWRRCEQDILKRQLKRAYYFSAEFLMGRTLGNNLINLGLQKELDTLLHSMGLDLNAAEENEPDAALGNGGLGRLAACFMDSLSTRDLPARGYGIRYHYGMFRQEIINNQQVEFPDDWVVKGDPWSVRRGNLTVVVPFKGHVETIPRPDGSLRFQLVNTEDVLGVPYDTPIIGWDSSTINTLRLWEAESVNGFNLQHFNNEDYQRAVEPQNRAQDISRVLYPNDRGPTGKILRLRQQYFFSSASLQDILREYKQIRGTDFSRLPQLAAIQLNDTHPVVAIPELMRLLMDQEGLGWEESWGLTQQVFSYTNHTVLAEALEMWPLDLFSGLLPRIHQIIQEINRRFMASVDKVHPHNRKYHHRMSIIADGMIKMAWLGIAGSGSVNGVAALHTEILKKEVLADWYGLWPEKFNNKTNGVTQRRWLKRSNPELASLLDETLGPGWTKNFDLVEGLKEKAGDPSLLEEIGRVKRNNKNRLAAFIQQETGTRVDPSHLFDVQIKRLHEYKRQLMNILSVMAHWQDLRDNPQKEVPPQVVIFGAKAASAYTRAKQIIHLINAAAQKINHDPAVKDRLKVIFIPNYRVSAAEVIIPAADISQQISTAGKEASGTGNMKLMMNGALTLGTMDGANIEIVEAVGRENAFIFGMTAQEVTALRDSDSYDPGKLLEQDPRLNRVLETLVDGSLGRGDHFREIYDSLVYGMDGNPGDEYFVLQDFAAYQEARKTAGETWKDSRDWNRRALINIAGSGRFSSDRTVEEYARDIWKIKSRV